MHLCDSSLVEDKAKVVEFYLHNMALPDMNLWDPNARLGDLQLMAMASWLNHEEKRAMEIYKIMAKELSEPLMIMSVYYRFVGQFWTRTRNLGAK